jgi:hypothetical protein
MRESVNVRERERKKFFSPLLQGIGRALGTRLDEHTAFHDKKSFSSTYVCRAVYCIFIRQKIK